MLYLSSLWFYRDVHKIEVQDVSHDHVDAQRSLLLTTKSVQVYKTFISRNAERIQNVDEWKRSIFWDEILGLQT